MVEMTFLYVLRHSEVKSRLNVNIFGERCDLISRK